MAEEKIIKVKKGAKKSFFEAKAPMTAAKIHLYAGSMEELEGRIVKLDLTRSLKGKNFELKLKIKKAAEGLEGEPISLELVGSYIRRMMRTGIDYVEDSFVVELKDGKARVKPFMITRNKVSRSVRRELRESAKKFLGEHLKARTIKEGFSEIMTNKIQKELFVKLKKIYPLALCEIRVFELA
ncbi:MAG: 40S ribosomal protein S3a/S1 [archaeon]|jgi:ribosomal protein S3AE|nr:40S ribosomal protein S3a/S1 [archaeon]